MQFSSRTNDKRNQFEYHFPKGRTGYRLINLYTVIKIPSMEFKSPPGQKFLLHPHRQECTDLTCRWEDEMTRKETGSQMLRLRK